MAFIKARSITRIGNSDIFEVELIDEGTPLTTEEMEIFERRFPNTRNRVEEALEVERVLSTIPSEAEIITAQRNNGKIRPNKPVPPASKPAY